MDVSASRLACSISASVGCAVPQIIPRRSWKRYSHSSRNSLTVVIVWLPPRNCSWYPSTFVSGKHLRNPVATAQTYDDAFSWLATTRGTRARAGKRRSSKCLPCNLRKIDSLQSLHDFRFYGRKFVFVVFTPSRFGFRFPLAGTK